nr:NADPH:quinone reductase [Mycobacterium europaeum]
MRAVRYTRTGPAREVLEQVDLPVPEPGYREVRVRVHASGVNPADVKRRSGWGRITLDTPYLIPHDDGAGVVDAVGPGVAGVHKGDRVWVFDARLGRQTGTAAEYVCVPDIKVEPLPASVDFATGASLGIPGRTAHRCLFTDGPIDGATVLVAGAAGSVGHSAVQQARLSGARVIGTVGREENRKVALDAGCDHVIDYRSDRIADELLELTDGHGFDRIVEVDAAANIDTDSRVIATNGTIAVYATDSGHAPKLPLWRLMNKSVNLRNVLLYNLPHHEHRLAADDLNRWIAAGDLTPRIGRRFCLQNTAAAHEAVEAGTGAGNVVVDIAAPA